MDPLMQAAERFIGGLAEAFERGASVVRMTSAPSYRSALQKSLRLLEWQPENRWPLVVVDGAPEVEAIKTQLEGEVEALATGLAEEGIVLPAASRLEPPADPLGEARALYDDHELGRGVATAHLGLHLGLAAERVVAGAGDYIDGLGLVLLPPANLGAVPEDVHRYAQLVAHLSRVAIAAPKLRLMAYDPGEGLAEVAPLVVPFAIDEAALQRYLEEAAEQAHEATADRPVAGVAGSDGAGGGARLSPTQRREVEEDLGRKLPSDDVAATLRTALFAAGRQMSEGAFSEAAQGLRAAAMLCRLSALPAEEVVVSLAAGSAWLSAQEQERALTAFAEARRLAEKYGLGAALQIQAHLGAGGVHLMAQAWADADAAYAQALAVAAGDDEKNDDAAVPVALVVELWRLRAHCAAEQSAWDAAVGHAEAALSTAEARVESPVALEATTLAYLVDQLGPRLEAAGRGREADLIRRRWESLKAEVMGAEKRAGGR
ncbi:MAG: hypothetical protein AAF928_00965 [Myxococcota bacterium]